MFSEQARELEEFCFKFSLNHMTAVTQTEAFAKLDEGTVKDFIMKVNMSTGCLKVISKIWQLYMCFHPQQTKCSARLRSDFSENVRNSDSPEVRFGIPFLEKSEN